VARLDWSGGKLLGNLLPEIKVPLCNTSAGCDGKQEVPWLWGGGEEGMERKGNGSARIMEKRNRVKFALYRAL